jgi:hypothetical protein
MCHLIALPMPAHDVSREEARVNLARAQSLEYKHDLTCAFSILRYGVLMLENLRLPSRLLVTTLIDQMCFQPALA